MTSERVAQRQKRQRERAVCVVLPHPLPSLCLYQYAPLFLA